MRASAGGCVGCVLMERVGLEDTRNRAKRVVTGGQHLYPHWLMEGKKEWSGVGDECDKRCIKEMEDCQEV